MTDWVKTRRKASLGIRRVIHAIQPVAKIAKEATQVLATIQKPSVVGVINAVGSALSTTGELIEVPDESPGWMLPTYVPIGMLQDALRRGGFRQIGVKAGAKGPGGNPQASQYDFTYPDSDQRVRIGSTGQLWWWEDIGEGDLRRYGLEPIRKALDAVLPPVINLTPPERDNERTELRGASLTHLTPNGVHKILDRTKSLLGQRRAILLEGRPGIGKTTAAQAIAREANLGRVLILDNSWLNRGRLLGDMFSMLSIGVIIIDDIDKVTVGLSAFELLRSACRLLILTANNGAHDSVIDAALARPARIDENFTITAQEPFKRPPFDRLSDKVWHEVSQWPQAYLNELENRLINTPGDLRLKDLAARLSKRTRSAAGLIDDTKDDPEPDWWGNEPIVT